MLTTYGEEVSREIIVGAELTRRGFDAAGAHLLAVSRAFASAERVAHAIYGPPDNTAFGLCITPAMATSIEDSRACIRVGGLGLITQASAFASFPAGAIGRVTEAEV